MITILLFLNVFANIIQSIISKEYTKLKSTSSLCYAMFSSLFSLIYFVIISKFNLSFNKSIVIYSLFCGLGIIASTVCCNMAVRTGSLALTNLIQNFSLAVPTLFGIFILKEPIGNFTVLALVFLVISLFLTNLKKEKYSINSKWIIWISISFLGNGLFATIQKLHQSITGGKQGNELMVLALFIAVIVLFIIILIFDRGSIKISLKNCYLPAAHGTMNGIGNMTLLLLAPIASASLVYPLLTSCSMVILTFISFLLYKEKFSVRQIIGIVFGIISSVLLAI